MKIALKIHRIAKKIIPTSCDKIPKDAGRAVKEQ
jgi:hypothetical protein